MYSQSCVYAGIVPVNLSACMGPSIQPLKTILVFGRKTTQPNFREGMLISLRTLLKFEGKLCSDSVPVLRRLD
jgi:hypothetical protein